jgi:fructokinase
MDHEPSFRTFIKNYMKTLCIGEALIDMVCTDKDYPLSQGTHFLAKPGGAPANVAAAIGAMGGDVALAARVGNDAFGEKLVQTMQSFGVSTQWMSRSPAHFTTIAFVSLLKNGDRDFLFNRGADGMLHKEELDAIPLDDISILHFGSATAFLPGPLQDAYRYLFEKSLVRNKFTSFDPNYRQLLFPEGPEAFIEQSWHFLSRCDFCKCSDDEAMMLTHTASVAEAARSLMERTGAVCAITIGSEGSLLCLNGEIFPVPSIQVNCIDSTGAGDAFVGAMLYQLSRKSNDEINALSADQWREIVAVANKAGARACEHFGAMETYRNIE